MAIQLIRRCVVATLVGVSAWVRMSRADEPVIQVPVTTTTATVILLPANLKLMQPSTQGPTPSTTEPSISVDPEKKTVRYRPLHDWLDNRAKKCGCWADYNTDYGCSNCHSECVWIFGSCRQFWREPCLKSPPPSPFGPEYDCPPKFPYTKH